MSQGNVGLIQRMYEAFLESGYAVLYDLLGDKITRMAIYAKPEEALEAAGLSE